jgi:4-diphosphocytidyl-2-C-methyl-D-erythritol kinase
VHRFVTEQAPAKLNLSLRVAGRRRDGYHLIDSVMVPIALRDSLRIGFRPAPTRARRVHLTLRGARAGVPRGPGNLVVRAAHGFLDAAGIGGEVDIVLHKRIPPRSGLGGGSSDAAAVLRGLARASRRRVAERRVLELAAALGADVPFFLKGRQARVGGVGDLVRTYRGKLPRWYVVAVPRRGVSTAVAYAGLRLTIPKVNSRLAPFRYSVSRPVNDLEKAVLPRRPDIGRLKECLLDAGARVALMSGSGSAVFGTFGSRRTATSAARRLPRGPQIFVVEAVMASSAARRRAGR